MRLKGLGVSPGVGIGKALVLKRGARDLGFRLPAMRVEREIARLEEARARSREQLQQIKARIAQSAGAEHAYLFDAQLLMLDDPMLIERAAEIIRGERLNAAAALERALEEISRLFDNAQDPFLRERKGEVSDVVGRLCMNLRAGGPADPFRDVEGPLVLVADELTPSMLAQLDWHRLGALVTDAGSWTYHTAILARSIHVPAVAGLHNATGLLAPGALLAVDGTTGEVIVEPGEADLRQLQGRQQRRAAYERSLEEYRTLVPVTQDGVRIRLEANLESVDDVMRARQHGAEGIGLFRSEFLLVSGRPEHASEEGQHAAYRRLVEAAAPGRVTVRTFDISEAQLGAGGTSLEAARAPLGLRGVRLSLANPEMFQAQLRALLHAAVDGPLRIMFPFVSCLEELRAARAAVEQAAESLRARGISPPPVPIGVMIEVPSAALAADILADEADFFSLGTNDLIQYCLAVDRTDERVSQLYEPLQPAILRMVRLVARAGRRRALPVSVCGEMASDPVLLTLLVGLGITEFSMAPSAIPLAKQVLRGLRAGDIAKVAVRSLRARTAADVERALIQFLAPLEIKHE